MKLTRLTVFAALTLVSACSSKPDLPEPPLGIPFDLTDQSMVADVNFRVSEYRSFMLGFQYTLTKTNDTARQEIINSMNESNVDDATMQILIQVLIIPLRPSSLEHEFRMNYSKQRLQATGSSAIYSQLDQVRLRPGVYRIVVRNLHASGGYKNTSPTLILASDPKSRPGAN